MLTGDAEPDTAPFEASPLAPSVDAAAISDGDQLPSSYDASANAAQLVLLVEFSDTAGQAKAWYDTATYGKTQWDRVIADTDAMDVAYGTSFREYLYKASWGACNVKSYFPQTLAGGTVAPITLSKPASAYDHNDTDLLREAVAAFNAAHPGFDASALDLNRDGSIDNVMILRFSDTEFASHKSNATEPLFIGSPSARLFDYTVVGAGGPSVTPGLGGYNASIAVHEFLHVLGAADYYRSGIPGDPVDCWDIMAQGGGYALPLAFTRESIGWATIPEKNASDAAGTYTFYDPLSAGVASGKQTQALKLRSSYSTSEYFVIEYRKVNKEGGSGPDRHIGGNGLIVYRVNERYADEGNLYGHDYVYVFRPGETSLSASAGKPMLAAISTEEYKDGRLEGVQRQQIGSLDPAKGITDGAICHYDGTNSGFLIKAVAQTDDSITVSVEVAAADPGLAWQEVVASGQSAPFGSASSPGVDVVTDGTSLYMLAISEMDGRSTVWRWNGSAWARFGATLTAMNHPSLAWHDGMLYVTGCTDAGALVVRRCDGSAWVQVASKAGVGRYGFTDLASVGGALYAAVGIPQGNVQLYRLSGSSLAQVASPLALSAAGTPQVIDLGGKVAVISVSAPGSAPWSTKLAIPNGSSWNTSTLLSEASSSLSWVQVGGTVYAYLGSYGSGRIVALGANGAIKGTYTIAQAANASQGGSLATDGEKLFLTLVDGNGLVRAYQATTAAPGSLTQVGGTVYATASGVGTTVVSGKLYCALPDGTAQGWSVRSRKVSDTVGPAPSISITQASVNAVPNQTYSGTPKTPKPVISYAGRRLKEGADYALTYASNVNVGTARITITGKGDFAGSRVVTFQIVRAPVVYRESRGADRYKTMELVAKGAAPSGTCQYAILARGDDFPDALAAAGLAGSLAKSSGKPVPIIITPSASLGTEARALLQRYQIKRVYVAGGGSAVSDRTLSQVRSMGITVSRIAGATRYETAVGIANTMPNRSKTCIVVAGSGYADALSVSPYSYATASPIFLASSGSLPSVVQSAIRTGGYTKAIIVGGVNAVPAQVERQIRSLGVSSVERWSGATRYQTSRVVAERMVATGVFSYGGGYVATGESFPDALTAAPWAAEARLPLLLVCDGNLEAVDRVLIQHRDTVRLVSFIGGPHTVSERVRSHVRSGLR